MKIVFFLLFEGGYARNIWSANRASQYQPNGQDEGSAAKLSKQSGNPSN
jgi:hypothetical protein